MNKAAVVEQLLKGYRKEPKQEQGCFFAPSNIALAKYWGKRDPELNLPVTSSLSISLGQLGAKTVISLHDGEEDVIFINGKLAERNSVFVKNLTKFLDLFRAKPFVYFQVKTEINIPIGAGVASSACGFAALIGALDQLYEWELSMPALSILARLGSGSASRSFWQDFVEWQAGNREDGMDSYGIPLKAYWPELCVGLLLLEGKPKALSSREAMQRTVLTSPFYSHWPLKQAADFAKIKEAIQTHCFIELGEIAESNALAMHALMLTSKPPILYANPKTIEKIHKIWYYRSEGLPIYFTQDAGPNLKLLFLEKDKETVHKLFPTLSVVTPFEAKE